MTLCEYLDRHEIIGTGLFIVVAFFVRATATDVLTAWARAWGQRGGKRESK